jgi:hypothetical protein
MKKTVKIMVFENEIEASLLNGILTERGIPHLIRSYRDSAYDGLWQTQSGWGHLEAREELKEEILQIFHDMNLKDEDSKEQGE